MMSDQTVAIVQARMSSSRLPGKVLLPLAGKEVLYHINARLTRVESIDKIVVATTAGTDDQPLRDYCQAEGIEVFSFAGSVDDLLGRYIACGRQYGADIIVMVDGDCPLVHPVTIDRMTQELKADKRADFCQLDERSIEGGVAVLRLAAFEKIAEQVNDPSHEEHAIAFLVENQHLFNIVDLDCERDFRSMKHRLWLDTPADYEFLSKVYERLYRPGAIVDLHDVVKLLTREPSLKEINCHVTQKSVRENHKRLVVKVNHIDREGVVRAQRILSLLIERYHVWITVLSSQYDEHWLKSNIAVVDKTDSEGDNRLEFNNGSEKFVARLSRDGAADMILGLSVPSNIEQAAEWVANYAGYVATASGYTETLRTRSSEGGYLDEIRECPVCSDMRLESIWEHESGITNGVCLRCGHVFLMKQLPKWVIDQSYKDYQQTYTEDFLADPSNPLFEFARQRSRLLGRVIGDSIGSLLEIGCAYGHFLSVLDQSVSTVGIEPSEDQSSFARRVLHLANIWQSSFDRFSTPPPDWPEEGFDAVCSFHVLEHIKSLDGYLGFVRSVLRDDGFLFLSVPELRTLPPDLIELYFIYRNWHLHSFSPESLSNLLIRNGFKIVCIEPEPSTAMYPSSFSVIAQKRVDAAEMKYDACGVARNSEAIRAFHEALERRSARLRDAFETWRSRGKNVAVYGGGIHTRALLELTGIGRDQVAMVIDDDPGKRGKVVGGIEICAFEEAIERGADVIVVSSLASEELILKRLESSSRDGVLLTGVYRDLMK